MIGDDPKPRGDSDRVMDKDDEGRVLRHGRSRETNRAATEQQQRSDFMSAIRLGTNEQSSTARTDRLRELQSALDTIERLSSGEDAITADEVAAFLVNHVRTARLFSEALKGR